MRIDFRPCPRGEWEKFRRYHYLNGELHRAAECHGAYFGDQIVAFHATMHFPHATSAKMKRGHRLVVLPDWQGVGIGPALAAAVARSYVEKGYRFFSTSSSVAFIRAMQRAPHWRLRRFGHTARAAGTVKFHRDRVRTATFEFVLA